MREALLECTISLSYFPDSRIISGEMSGKPRNDWDSPYILEWFLLCIFKTEQVERFLKAARPGTFADPDMLLVGQTTCSSISRANGMHCGPITPTQEQTQMAMWAIFAAPLMMSNDLPSVSAHARALLTNAECLRINQDPLARQGRRVVYEGGEWPQSSLQVWARELEGTDIAVALYNFNHAPATITLRFSDVGYSPSTAVRMLDVFGNGKVSNSSVHAGTWQSPLLSANETVLLRLLLAD